MTMPPRVMVFPVTLKCNSRCRSCSIWRVEDAASTHAALPLLEKVVTDAFLCENIESVNVSGGEPFSHPELGTFAARILERFVRLRELCLNTDGHLLEEMISMLASTLPLARAKGVRLRVYISLDGLGDHHDSHRRHPGAFLLADRALRWLADHRRGWLDELRVTASFTVTNRNVGQMRPVLEYVREMGIKVDYNLAATPEVFIGSAGLIEDFTVKPEQFDDVRQAITRVCGDPIVSNFSQLHYATMLATLETNQRGRGCFFPQRGFVLMPDGKVYVCGTFGEFFFGDLASSDFESLWFGALRDSVRKHLIPDMCSKCYSNSYKEWSDIAGAVV